MGPTSLTDAQAIDLSIKGIGSLVAIVGAIIAALGFVNEQRKANKNAVIEAHKPFTVKQQEVYFDLVTTTAVISNRYGEPEWEPAFKHFWVLYWGVVPIVADAGVSQTVDNFADTLEHLDNLVLARNASMNLARACRVALGDAWRTDLEEVPLSGRQS